MASEDSINSVWRRFRCESCPMVSAYPSHVKGMVRLLRSMVTYLLRSMVKYTG